jgi:hypothetical protein
MEVNLQRRNLLKLGGWLPIGWLLSSCGGGGSSQQSVNGTPKDAFPVIVSHPENQMAVEGEVITFSIVATGNSLTYQWQQDGKDIPGASNVSFTTPPIMQGDDGAMFRVIVTNAAGSVTSNQAILTASRQSVSVDKLGITVDSVAITVDEI